MSQPCSFNFDVNLRHKLLIYQAENKQNKLEIYLSSSDSPQCINELEFNFLAWHFIHISAALLNHFRYSCFQLTSPFAERYYVLIQEVPLLAFKTNLDDSF